MAPQAAYSASEKLCVSAAQARTRGL